ncbi:MAG: cellulase family glycosylhydrolase [Bdellovibrionota bacterium]
MMRTLLILGFGLLFCSPVFASAFPYHTQGRAIIDADGEAVHLKAVNWYGANLEGQVAHGLDQRPVQDIADLIKSLGFNSVRLTYSNAMIHDTSPVDARRIQANPQLMGKTSLEVFDATVLALARAGVGIMLNNHTSASVWCCGYETDGLWHYSGKFNGRPQTEDEWVQDWKFLTKRYRGIPAVIAMDLRNEVRTAKWKDTFLPNSPNWGSGDSNDWARAAERAGNEILDDNPNVLIIVEGINWAGTIGLLGGYRPHLMKVLDRAVQLKIPGRLVYAAHNYAFVGPNHNGHDKSSFGQIKYSDMDEKTFYEQIEAEWGFIFQDEKFYSAPVILSEFGIEKDNASEKGRIWFKRIVHYLAEKKLHFAYWPLNPEAYGLLTDDWQSMISDWRSDSIQELLSITADPLVKKARYASITLQSGDHTLTTRLDDWLPGDSKGTCAEDTRLIGLSRDNRGLCTDEGEAINWTKSTVTVANDERTLTDWAPGYIKYSCPEDHYAIGYSKGYRGSNGLLCMKSPKPLARQCRTLWFNRSDERAQTNGGDFARGSFKGQCSADEYIEGLAQRFGHSSALHCCAI